MKSPASKQNEIVLDWMKSQVQWQKGFGFLLPQDLIEVFWQCQEIIETPHFQPAMNTL
ncbi:MAG: hypothetical protein ACXWR0_16570 [Bdellovibrio sp.]